MQKFFARKRSLARKAAAMMSAVMLFTSEAGLFTGNIAVVNAADDEVSEEAAEESSDVNASDGAFSVTVSKLQYGEDGSNTKGNLDVIFAPRLIVDGAEQILGKDYTTSYKFFADKEEALAVTADTFDEADGLVLSEVPAGTTVYAVVKASADNADHLVSTEVTITKRVISLSYEASAEAAIEGRDVAEDGSYVIAEDEVDYSGFDLDIADGFAYELNAEELLCGDVVLDLSGVDLSVDSYSSVPMEVELDPAYDDNYEIDKNIHGDYYFAKAQYYVVFTANNNGEVFTKTYAFPSYSFEGTAADLLKKLGKTEEVFSTADGEYNLGGFLDTGTDHLTGWTVYVDGFNANYGYYAGNAYSTANVDPDASLYDASGTKKEFNLSGTKDYHFVAQISKAAAENIFVSVIPSVYYDTRAHVALGTKVDAKKQAADLRIKVNYAVDGDVSYIHSYNELEMNKDYSVRYYNNTDASMAVSSNGTYIRIKEGDQRPRAEITGKGEYAGFSATVYFDILPMNMGDYEIKYDYIHEHTNGSCDGFFENNSMDHPYTYVYSLMASVSGISRSTYVLKKGKISGIKPKLTKHYYTYGTNNSKVVYNTVTLKAGTDYTIEIRKWNDASKSWKLVEGVTDPNKINAKGDYLLIFRGINNYCGAVFGGDTNNEFGDEGVLLNPLHDTGAECQFRVADNADYDMENARISIGTRSIKWDGEKHDHTSFNITVKDKKNKELVYGKDYVAEFVPIYRSINGTADGEKVTAANVYTVKLTGKGDYYGSNTRKTVTIQGLKLNKKFFIVSGDNWELSEAGKAAGLVMHDYDSPYYISFDLFTMAEKRILNIGGSGYVGQAIDPAVSVRFPVKQSKMQLKDAIAKGYISFKVSESGIYNIKGAMPDSIMYETGKHYTEGWDRYILYNGFTTNVRVYDPETNYNIGYADLTFSFRNNTGLGRTAKVTVKVSGSDCLKGSAEIGTFTVVTNEVTYIPVRTAADNYGNTSRIYAVVTDAPRSKGSLDKPNVRLYQVYRDKKGVTRSALLSSKQYTINKGTEVGGAHVAVSTYITNGKTNDFNFKGTYGENKGVYSGIFALYEKKLTSAQVSAVTIGGKKYKVNKGVIDGDFAPVFTGDHIQPKVDVIKIADAELKYGNDYDLDYSSQFSAGDKSGTIIITLKYNVGRSCYEYSGRTEISFKITPAEGITL